MPILLNFNKEEKSRIDNLIVTAKMLDMNIYREDEQLNSMYFRENIYVLKKEFTSFIGGVRIKIVWEHDINVWNFYSSIIEFYDWERNNYITQVLNAPLCQVEEQLSIFFRSDD